MSTRAAGGRDGAVAEAAALMSAFAERTGLVGGKDSRRYLWTDAFAVCNFHALARTQGAGRDAQAWTELAVELIDAVHRQLGRHRADDPREGWISGLSESEALQHPTRGGLRIGKPLPERPPGAPFDERLEWERDGQYFHYLTKWMQALDQTARWLREPRYHRQACELAVSAQRAFTITGSGGHPRMVWKRSIDLSRVLVPSMGQHDPLDGLITAVQLQSTARGLPGAPEASSLAPIVEAYEAMCRGGQWATADPLGLGGLLTDACRVAQLMREHAFAAGDALLEELLQAAEAGLAAYAHEAAHARPPASQRLAFRELGLAIGLSSLGPIERALTALRASASLRARVDAIAVYEPLGAEIERFWRDPRNRATELFDAHRDINEVMLATCLLPEGMLRLPAPGSTGQRPTPPRP